MVEGLAIGEGLEMVEGLSFDQADRQLKDDENYPYLSDSDRSFLRWSLANRNLLEDKYRHLIGSTLKVRYNSLQHLYSIVRLEFSTWVGIYAGPPLMMYIGVRHDSFNHCAGIKLTNGCDEMFQVDRSVRPLLFNTRQLDQWFMDYNISIPRPVLGIISEFTRGWTIRNGWTPLSAWLGSVPQSDQTLQSILLS